MKTLDLVKQVAYSDAKYIEYLYTGIDGSIGYNRIINTPWMKKIMMESSSTIKNSIRYIERIRV